MAKEKNKNVTRYTRAGKVGKILLCPLCSKKVTVYHFSWSAITCQNCDRMIDKKEWLIF